MTTKLAIFGYHVTPPYRHLQEHLDEVADGAKIETEDDVYFGYFNVHDTDKDGAFLFPSKTNRLVLVQDISTWFSLQKPLTIVVGFLDGLELLNSFGDHRAKKVDESYTDEQYEQDLKTYSGNKNNEMVYPAF